jgi:hypothetical protein
MEYALYWLPSIWMIWLDNKRLIFSSIVDVLSQRKTEIWIISFAFVKKSGSGGKVSWQVPQKTMPNYSILTWVANSTRHEYATTHGATDHFRGQGTLCAPGWAALNYCCCIIIQLIWLLGDSSGRRRNESASCRTQGFFSRQTKKYRWPPVFRYFENFGNTGQIPDLSNQLTILFKIYIKKLNLTKLFKYRRISFGISFSRW